MRITKKDCKNKHFINMENYLMKKIYIKRENGRNRYGNMPKEDNQKLRDFTILSIQYI